jgi:siroheme synthase
MPGTDLSIYAAAWLADGEAPEMPCMVVSRVSQPEQHVVHTCLGELATVTMPAAPALLLAGWALQQRNILADDVSVEHLLQQRLG